MFSFENIRFLRKDFTKLMLRIVGIERNIDAMQEFVLLQNQGTMRINLRGHGVIADEVIDVCGAAPGLFLFNEDVFIPSGVYVFLATGPTEARWQRNRDGVHIYRTSMQRTQAIWQHVPGTLHVVQVQHSFCEKPTVCA